MGMNELLLKAVNEQGYEMSLEDEIYLLTEEYKEAVAVAMLRHNKNADDIEKITGVDIDEQKTLARQKLRRVVP